VCVTRTSLLDVMILTCLPTTEGTRLLHTHTYLYNMPTYLYLLHIVRGERADRRSIKTRLHSWQLVYLNTSVPIHILYKYIRCTWGELGIKRFYFNVSVSPALFVFGNLERNCLCTRFTFYTPVTDIH